MNSLKPKLHHFNRGRIIVITLTLVAVIWILAQQFLFRDAQCINRMCPVADYGYLLRVVLVIAISSVAFWLLKSPKQPS